MCLRLECAHTLELPQIEPDVEFGGFSVLFGPSDGDLSDRCLVLLDLGARHCVTRVGFVGARHCVTREEPTGARHCIMRVGPIGARYCTTVVGKVGACKCQRSFVWPARRSVGRAGEA